MRPAPLALEDRVDRLERSNARLRAIVGLVALAGAAIVLGGQDAPKAAPAKFDRVEVRRLVLVDEKGGNLAELGVDSDGRSGLKVGGARSDSSAYLGMDEDGDPLVTLRNDAGMAQVILSVAHSGDSAAVVLCNAGGKGRASTTVKKDGTPLFGLFDDRDGYRASLSVLPSGSPYLKLDDTAGALKIEAAPELRWIPK